MGQPITLRRYIGSFQNKNSTWRNSVIPYEKNIVNCIQLTLRKDVSMYIYIRREESRRYYVFI